MTKPSQLFGVIPLLVALVSVGLVSDASPIRGLTAEALRQPGLSIELSNVAVRSLPITHETFVDYTLENRFPYALKQVGFVVAVLGADGSPRAGELVCQAIDVKSGQRLDREMRLGNLLYVDGRKASARIVVAIRGYTDDLGRYAQASSVESLVAAAVRNEPLELTTQEEPPTEPPCGNCQQYCGSTGSCAQTARTMCGSRGVCEFSCSCNTQGCSCQFSCCSKIGIIEDP